MAGGSVDRNNTYGFEVAPTRIPESAARSLSCGSTAMSAGSHIQIYLLRQIPRIAHFILGRELREQSAEAHTPASGDHDLSHGLCPILLLLHRFPLSPFCDSPRVHVR